MTFSRGDRAKQFDYYRDESDKEQVNRIIKLLKKDGRITDKFTEKVKLRGLTPEEVNKAFDNAFDQPINLDHKPSPEEILTIRLEAVAVAQLNRFKTDNPEVEFEK